MAASLTTFVGLAKAASKSKPTQPAPRFAGSAIALPPRTGVGIPIDTTSQLQPCACSSTPVTVRSGVSSGPEPNRRRPVSVEASSLTCEPPTSTASTIGVVVEWVIAGHYRMRFPACLQRFRSCLLEQVDSAECAVLCNRSSRRGGGASASAHGLHRHLEALDRRPPLAGARVQR